MSDLNFRVLWGSLDLTDYPFGVEWGTDVGAPAKVYEALSALLADGEIEVSTRDSNRTMTFTVLAEAADLLSHSELEAMLAIEAGKDRNTLTLIPGDSFGPASVFDTYEAELVWVRSDDLEIAGFRRYQITMPAYPFPRSEDETVVAAVGSGGTQPDPVSAVVEACSSTDGWTATSAPTPLSLSVVSGNLRVLWTTANVMAISRSVSFDPSLTPYLYIDWRRNFGNPAIPPVATLAGQQLEIFANGPSPDPSLSGFSRTWYRSMSAPVSDLLEISWRNIDEQRAGSLDFAEVGRTNISPVVGTGRQQFRSLDVGGSQRSQGSLQISHDTDSLGEVLVYTNEDDGSGYQPASRSYRVSGGATPSPDSTTASGSYEPLDGGAPVIIEIPIGSVPQGTYSLMARIKGDTSSITGVSFSAATRVGSTDYGLRSGAKIIGTSNVWKLFELDRLTLPPTAVPAGSSAKVRLSMSSSNRLDLDEVYLFNTDIGDLSWVDCGTAAPSAGGSSNRLWLDTASLDWPRPAALLGTQPDRSDARHVDSITEHRAEGVHMLNPGRLNVFSLTSNALNAAVSLRHYRRWHSNAGS